MPSVIITNYDNLFLLLILSNIFFVIISMMIFLKQQDQISKIYSKILEIDEDVNSICNDIYQN